MLNPPSYLYSAVDSETLSLTEELEALGGGDARIASLELHIILGSKNNKEPKGHEQIYWDYDKVLGVRDALQPSDQPASDSMKYVPVTSTMSLNSDDSYRFLESNKKLVSLVEDSSRWLAEGFNNCIIAVGPRETGKTSTLFGPLGDFNVVNHYTIAQEMNRREGHSSFIPAVLSSTYLKKETARKSRNERFTIGLSAWVLYDNNIVDLLVPGKFQLQTRTKSLLN